MKRIRTPKQLARLKITHHDWYIRNKDKHKSNTKQYYENNRVWFSNHNKIYRREHLEESREYLRRYYAENRLVLNMISKHWRDTHREDVRIYRRNRRAREKNAVGSFSTKDFTSLKILLGHHCLGCWVVLDNLVSDHIIPLSKGGTNFIDNIQPLCSKCNRVKSDYYPVPNLLLACTI